MNILWRNRCGESKIDFRILFVCVCYVNKINFDSNESQLKMKSTRKKADISNQFTLRKEEKKLNK